MLKRISILTLLLFLAASPTWTEPWGGAQFTMASGVAQRIVGIRTMASSLFIQMKEGSSTGIGYVLYAPTDVSCLLGGAGTTLIAELQPSTSTAPGGNAVIPSNPDPQGGLDIAGYCIQAAHTGDIMIVSWNLRN